VLLCGVRVWMLRNDARRKQSTTKKSFIAELK
jgi:hypothetical protein